MAQNQWISSNPTRADWESSYLSFHDDANSTTTHYRTFRETHSQPIDGSEEVTGMEGSGDTLSPPEGILSHLPTGGSQSSGYSSDGAVSNLFTNCTINIHCPHGTCGAGSGSFVQDCQPEQLNYTGGSISPIEEAVKSLMPQVVDGIDPVSLLPHLTSKGLVSKREVDYIMNPHNCSQEKKVHIVHNVLKKGADALERFVDCLNESHDNPRHPELAQLIREAVCTLCPSEFQDKHSSQRTENRSCTSMNRVLLAMNDKSSGVKRERRASNSSKSSDSTITDDMQKQHTIAPEYPVSIKTGNKSSRGDTNSYSTVPACAQKVPKVDDDLEDQRLDWLEESVDFTHCSERVMLTSETSCSKKRKVLHHEILSQDHQDRRPKWLILLPDMLLLLEPQSQKESTGLAALTTFQWFCDNKYTTATPLLLSTLEIREVKELPRSLDICFTQPGAQQKNQLRLDACSERARNYLIKIVQRTIQDDRRSRQLCALSTRSLEPRSPHGKPSIVLIVVGVTGIAKSGLFCTVRLGRKRPLRTETVKGPGKAHWNHKFEFWDFHTKDHLEIRTYQENYYRPHGSIFLRHVIRNNTISYERICTNRTEIAEIKGHSSIFVSFGDIAAPSQISNIDLLGSVRIKVSQALCHTDTQEEFNLVKDMTNCGKITLCMGLREELKEMYV